MFRRAVFGLAICILAACASLPEGHSVVSRTALLDGKELFATPVAAADEVDILAVSAAMHAFVTDSTRDTTIDSERFRRLMAGLLEAGYFNLSYDPDSTYTAEQVFRRRAGNCLSFTNLFVALARDARLDVVYETVDVPPIWDSDDGWVILNNHINILVRGVRTSARVGIASEHDYVVDFNTVDYRASYKRRAVSDRTAFALYYANRGVEEMRAGDKRAAFAYFKRSIAMDPDVAGTWVDLGALYSRAGQVAYAEAAFHQALALRPDDNSALTNLARLYEQSGNVELAANYRARVQRYQSANPYYHYTWAVAAYRDADYSRALQQIRAAIELKNDDHRFYYLQALVRYDTGDIGGARSAIALAKRYSDDAAIKQRYASKLAALAAH